MELLLQRIDRQSSHTGGKLYVNGVYECDTVEDTDRDKNSNGILEMRRRLCMKLLYLMVDIELHW